MRKASASHRYRFAKTASQMRVAYPNMAWNTGFRSPGELEMICSTCEVAACCSSASASFFSSPDLDARLRTTGALAFVPLEPGLRVWLFAPFRDKVTPAARRETDLGPPTSKPNTAGRRRVCHPRRLCAARTKGSAAKGGTRAGGHRYQLIELA